jgi:hypothetical protein
MFTHYDAVNPLDAGITRLVPAYQPARPAVLLRQNRSIEARRQQYVASNIAIQWYHNGVVGGRNRGVPGVVQRFYRAKNDIQPDTTPGLIGHTPALYAPEIIGYAVPAKQNELFSSERPGTFYQTAHGQPAPNIRASVVVIKNRQ